MGTDVGRAKLNPRAYAAAKLWQQQRVSGLDDDVLDQSEGQWGAVSGADFDATIYGVKARGVWNRDGKKLNAWIKLEWPSGEQLLVHATTDLDAIERELKTLPEVQQQAAAVGWGFFKKLLRKTGISKVVSSVTNLAKKALNNPLIKTALMATPVGQAAYAIQRGAQMVQKAVQGFPAARKFVAFTAQQAARGIPGGVAAMKLLRAGAQQIPGCPRVSGDDDRQWLSFAGADLSLVVGEDQVTIDEDADALLTFATAGQFEGLRWFASRMAPQSMYSNPNAFSRRDALLLGRQAGAQRFAR